MSQSKYVRRSDEVKKDYIGTVRAGFFPGLRIKKQLVQLLAQK